MGDELVSIVMATYNGDKYLRQQLDSILEQTYQHFELIVVDDSSTDATLTILNEYAILDARIHVFPAENNLGLVPNFERGLKLANGNFIALSDQDDIFRQDKIEVLLTELKNNPDRDLAVSDLSLIDENGKEFAQSLWHYQRLNPQQGKPFRRLIYSNFATGCAMMFRRRLLNIALPFPPDCLVHDWWLAVVSASSKAGGICLVNKHLTYYRQHGSNVYGAIKARSSNVVDIISRILAAPPEDKTVFEKKMTLYLQQSDRLTGYLQSSMWSSKERKMIEQCRELFVDYAHDAHSTLLSRITKLPQRLSYALVIGGVRPCLWVILHTIFHYK